MKTKINLDTFLNKTSFQDAAAQKDEEFVSADQFTFELDQSGARMTRARRSSMSLSSAPLTKVSSKTRRQTMLPAVSETTRTSSRGAKPVMEVSPTKKFSKSTKNILNDEDILSKLDTSDPVKESKPVKKVTSSSVVKAPVKSKIPIKSPPSASKTAVRRSRRVSGDPVSLKEEKKPVAKSRRQTMMPAIAEAKSPAKKAPKSPVDVIKDVKKVEIRLKQLKLKEDPNLIFSMLEETPDKKDRVATVVQQIVNNRLEESPVTRNKQPKIKAEKQSPKKAMKKETKTPKRSSKVSLPPVQTPEPAVPIKSEKVTPKPEIKHKTEPKSAETTSKKRKQTATATATPVQNKRPKLDKSDVKTPGSAGKETKKQKTPSREVERYKQRTPAPGSLRKPLKRLAGAKFTPAQVKPSDVLRRNMIRKVETEIVAKLSKRPDSSPYTLKSGENSPVFTKVTGSSGVKSHLTGTPVRAMPRLRKFGTTIQPCSLLEESTAPGTEVIKRVSSSTPVRPRLVTDTEPHPLEAVEATPIRPPPSRASPLSPPPEMVTGKLGALCSIM